jgi:hypothetical protein
MALVIALQQVLDLVSGHILGDAPAGALSAPCLTGLRGASKCVLDRSAQ